MSANSSSAHEGGCVRLVACLVLVGGCDYTPKVPPHDWRRDAQPDTVSDASSDATGEAAADVIIAGNGLPCEVQRLLARACWNCHGATPSSDAPMPLTTWYDFQAPARLDPTTNVGVRCLARMRNAANPMPPPPATLTAAEIDAFAAWLDAGMPPGTCDEPIDDPFAGPVMCTTQRFWLDGNEGSSSMHPGRDCIGCHLEAREGPRLWVAGTVYATGHEPDDCYGVPRSGALVVEITDARGRIYRLPTNKAGNFFLEREDDVPLALPYTARVIDAQGNQRAMSSAQSVGSCNTCHTTTGAEDAPGRVVAPSE
jgi:mono/diheme cytochrome c family protein